MLYEVRIATDETLVRKYPGIGYRIIDVLKKDEIYTITLVLFGWGRLPDGGWIELKDTERV